MDLPPLCARAHSRGKPIRDYLEAGRHRGSVRTVENQARHYFGIEPDATLDDISLIAEHPVLHVHDLPGSI